MEMRACVVCACVSGWLESGTNSTISDWNGARRNEGRAIVKKLGNLVFKSWSMSESEHLSGQFIPCTILYFSFKFIINLHFNTLRIHYFLILLYFFSFLIHPNWAHVKLYNRYSKNQCCNILDTVKLNIRMMNCLNFRMKFSFVWKRKSVSNRPNKLDLHVWIKL